MKYFNSNCNGLTLQPSLLCSSKVSTRRLLSWFKNLRPCFHLYQVLNDDGHLVDEDGGIHIDGLYIPPAPAPAKTFDNTGPRLIITHIECFNFKSYAGKQANLSLF